MTKEELQERIIAINQELVQTRANGTKLEGHLAEAHHWLATLFKAEIDVPAEPVEPCEQEDEVQEAA